VATADAVAAAVTVAAEAGVAAAAWFGGDGWLDAQGPHMACAMSVADSLATGIVAQMWTMEATRGEGPSCLIQDWWVMGVVTVMTLWLCTDDAVAIAVAAYAGWWFGSKLRRTRPTSGVCNGRGKEYCHRHCRSK